MNDCFARSEALLGERSMARLRAARILVVGIGGVGSWCAEALVRTGLGQVTLMDDDAVAASNVNRQCPATSRTIGRPKVEVMAERLREINPACAIEALNVRYAADPGANPSLGRFDVVVDAIDSVDCKARLILDACAAGVPVVSSMGAALRTDPTQVRVARFEKVEGDGLAKALRSRFRKTGEWPGRFTCVWSGERPLGLPSGRSIPKGSLMPVTATFGMCLASEAIKLLVCSCLPD